MAHFRTVRIGTQEIQERFEEAGLREPHQFGVVVVEARSGTPGPNAPDDLPIGTRSVELSYRLGDSRGPEVARAHVFKLPDGSYGASRTPDPKRLVVGDTIYILDRTLDRPAGES